MQPVVSFPRVDAKWRFNYISNNLCLLTYLMFWTQHSGLFPSQVVKSNFPKYCFWFVSKQTEMYMSTKRRTSVLNCCFEITQSGEGGGEAVKSGVQETSPTIHRALKTVWIPVPWKQYTSSQPNETSKKVSKACLLLRFATSSRTNVCYSVSHLLCCKVAFLCSTQSWIQQQLSNIPEKKHTKWYTIVIRRSVTDSGFSHTLPKYGLVFRIYSSLRIQFYWVVSSRVNFRKYKEKMCQD